MPPICRSCRSCWSTANGSAGGSCCPTCASSAASRWRGRFAAPGSHACCSSSLDDADALASDPVITRVEQSRRCSALRCVVGDSRIDGEARVNELLLDFNNGRVWLAELVTTGAAHRITQRSSAAGAARHGLERGGYRATTHANSSIRSNGGKLGPGRLQQGSAPDPTIPPQSWRHSGNGSQEGESHQAARNRPSRRAGRRGRRASEDRGGAGGVERPDLRTARRGNPARDSPADAGVANSRAPHQQAPVQAGLILPGNCRAIARSAPGACARPLAARWPVDCCSDLHAHDRCICCG